MEQRMTDAAITACPACAAPVKRLISRNLTVQFKGPGFHVNDYPSKGAAGAGRTKDEAGQTEPAKAPAEPTKPESKPAAGGV
jgi:predicted nucleic acid-binding Zn ribbon protein